MMTSGDIAQAFAAQNAMFMGQNAYAGQIGISTPGTGLGAYGSQGPQAGHHSPIPGHHAPPSFNYGGGGMLGAGYGGGNRFGASVMSGLGAAAPLGTAALGVATMFRPFSAMAPFVDPFAAFGAARGVGLGMGASLGAAMLPIGAGMAAGAMANAFVHGGQQQFGINQSLGQNFNFWNPSSRSGMGFNRDQAQAIGDQIRQLAHVPEMLTSVQELTSLLPQLKQSGLMQGVHSASEFNQRFKEAISTIKETAKVLGTTMNEAAEFFAHSRSVGFFGKTDQIKNALNVQFTSGVTGMTAGQVMGMQQAGANFATAMGARRSLGTRAVTNIAQNIGMAQREGFLSEGMLEDMTGMSGPEAVQATAERMAQAMAGLSRTPAGRLAMAALVKFDKNGKAVGLDDEKVARYNRGELSLGELKRMASGMTNAQKISWVHRGADLAMDLAGKVGPGGIGEFFDDFANGVGGEERAKRILSMHTGLNAVETDFVFQMRGVGANGEQGRMEAFRRREANLRERSSPEAIMRRLKTKLHTSLFGGAEHAGAEAFTNISKAWDDAVDDLFGRHIISVSEDGVKALRQAFAGGSNTELKKMFTSMLQVRPGDAGAQLGSTLRKGLIGAATVGGWMLGGGVFSPFVGTATGMGAAALMGDGFDDAVNRFFLGNTSDSDFRYMERLTGGSHKNTDARLEILADRTRLLKGFNKERLAGAQSAIRGFIEDNKEFINLDESDKVRYLRDRINGATFRDGKSFLGVQRGLDEIKHVLGREGLEDIDAATALIAAAGPKASSSRGIDFLSMKGGGGFLSNKRIAGIHRDVMQAEEDLGKAGLDGMTVALLKENPKAREVLGAAIADPDVADALMKRDAGSAMAALAKKGISVDASMIPGLKTALSDIQSKNKDGKITRAIDAYKSMKGAESAGVFLNQFSIAGAKILQGVGKAKGLSNGTASAITGLANAMQAVTDSSSEDEFGKNIDSVKARISSMSETLNGLGDTERAAAISAMGDLGAAFSQSRAAIGTLGRRGGSMTIAELAKELHMSEGDAATLTAGLKTGGRVRLDKDTLSKMEGRLAGMYGADSLVKGANAAAGDKDNKLADVMNKMLKGADAQITVLTAIADKLGAANAKDGINRWRASYNPAEGSDLNGNPTLGVLQ